MHQEGRKIRGWVFSFFIIRVSPHARARVYMYIRTQRQICFIYAQVSAFLASAPPSNHLQVHSAMNELKNGISFFLFSRRGNGAGAEIEYRARGAAHC